MLHSTYVESTRCLTTCKSNRVQRSIDHLLPDGLVLLPGGVPCHPLQEVALVAFLVDLGALGADLGTEGVLSHRLVVTVVAVMMFMVVVVVKLRCR